ncbi:MAG TPA: DUF2750 domain-containing protein [Myxococcota bacterium]|nr:DUF2750 domain-containing protein [Myxococcota bacterium]
MPAQPRTTAVQLRLAHFLGRVVREGGAWSVVHQGEPIVIHVPREDVLPLWSSEVAARAAQRRGWPQLATGELSLCTLVHELLPSSQEHRISIGICGSTRSEEIITIPADWLERALRAGIETGWRTALD